MTKKYNMQLYMHVPNLAILTQNPQLTPQNLRDPVEDLTSCAISLIMNL